MFNNYRRINSMHDYIKFISEEMEKNDQCCQDTIVPYFDFMEISDKELEFLNTIEKELTNDSPCSY
jgi:hypothetical protein